MANNTKPEIPSDSVSIISDEMEMMMYELLKSDFDQRSVQMNTLSDDHSKNYRLAIMVWGAPLLMLGVNFFKEPTFTGKEFVAYPIFFAFGIIFTVCSLINTSIFAVCLKNRTTAFQAASAINYYRSIFFHKLKRAGLEIDEYWQRFLGIDNGKMPAFEWHQGGFEEFEVMKTINIIYAVIGFIGSTYSAFLGKDNPPLFSAGLVLMVCCGLAIGYIVYKNSRINSRNSQKLKKS